MANVKATRNGFWSDTAVWDTSSLPTSADDVYANNYSVTIDINPTILSLRNTTAAGISAGGGFFLNNGVEVRSRLIEGGGSTTQAAVTFLSAAPNTSTLYSHISTFTTAAAGPYGVRNTGTGTLNISGNILGGWSYTGSISRGVVENGSGTLNLTGNILGNIGGTTRFYGSFYNQGAGTVNIIGTVQGGGSNSGGDTYGIGMNGSGGTLNILGDVYSPAVSNSPSINISNTNNTVSITGNMLGRATGFCIWTNTNYSLTNSTVTIYGYVSGGNPSGVGVRGGATATTTTIYGNVYGGLGANAYGIQLDQSGTITVYGNAYGGFGSSAYGAYNNGTGITYISGNAYGGSGQAAPGAYNGSSSGVVYLAGDAIGGTTASQINSIYATGAYNNSTGSIFIYGSAKASSIIHGAWNNSTGLIYAKKVVANEYGFGSVGVNAAFGLVNSQNGKAYAEQVEFGSRGQSPISGPVYIVPSNQNTLVSYTTALGQTVTFYNSLSVSGLVPSASSVRLGTVYNVGNSTGTMAVPSASAVQFGVAVDNTVGTAALTPQSVWGYARLSATEPNSLGDRLRNTATTQSIGYQIASFKS